MHPTVRQITTWFRTEAVASRHPIKQPTPWFERALSGTPRERSAEGGREVTIRLSSAEDRGALRRLAQLDSQRPPAGESLLAIVDGEVWAALPLGGGDAIANPFRPTADIVELLRIRDAALRAS